MDSLGSYGNILLYLTRFISRAKLSVKTAQLLTLLVTSDAAGWPARTDRALAKITMRALALGKNGPARPAADRCGGSSC